MGGKRKGKGEGPPPPPPAPSGSAPKAKAKAKTQEEIAAQLKRDEEKMLKKLEKATQFETDPESMNLDADALAEAKKAKEATFMECPLCGFKMPGQEFERHWTGHENCILEDWLYLGSKDNVNVKTMYRRGITHILNTANHLHLADDQTSCTRLQSFQDDLVEKKEEVGEDDDGLKFVVRSYEWEDREDWVNDNLLPNIDNIDGDPKLSIRAATRWLHDCKVGGKKVLVHCSMGISRSSTTIIAYLMEYEGLSLKQAWQLTREKRKIIRPNAGLMKLLGAVETKLKGGEPTLTEEDLDSMEKEEGKLFAIGGTFDDYGKEVPKEGQLQVGSDEAVIAEVENHVTESDHRRSILDEIHYKEAEQLARVEALEKHAIQSGYVNRIPVLDPNANEWEIKQHISNRVEALEGFNSRQATNEAEKQLVDTSGY